MHVVDEWVELAEVARAVDIYEAVLRTVLAQS
jgi:acetylornithine deacetylase/succinyl-diaminopimelate desuccinylase-like protein